MGNFIDTIEKAMEFIYGTSWKGSLLGLSRITELMRLMGDPQKQLKFVHIAGTNGKGSTAAMLASILTEGGYKTGLYTSPYLHKFSEMIQVNGVSISDKELISRTSELQEYTKKMADAPTEYEIITALALLHYHHQQCDIVVLEVGLGGRIDSTNVIDTPEVAVITAIGLDHMEQLGGTVEKIAGEKAGIIKPNGVAVCHPQIFSVEQVIREKCAETNTHVTFVADDLVPLKSRNYDGQVFDYGGFENLTIPLLGEHQLRNASVVIEVVKALNARGWSISDNALKNGLRNTSWAGRFEVLMKSPVFVADVAHNPQGIQATMSTMHSLDCAFYPIIIFGVLADKDYEKMAEILIPYSNGFILVTPENPRALPAAELEQCIKRLNKTIETTVCETLEQAVKHALEIATEDDRICALGSLSMIGKIRNIVKGQ
ncbi:MAG: bifunctional folylpolyglutamate synthase/dihydrofolate synthase [Defluviitaleaceae bacterium]|nr:bifunctional folylpolyglutamate synthase/dihydrofolate synthase [Defluviitaleaceae bacterium]